MWASYIYVNIWSTVITQRAAYCSWFKLSVSVLCCYACFTSFFPLLPSITEFLGNSVKFCFLIKSAFLCKWSHSETVGLRLNGALLGQVALTSVDCWRLADLWANTYSAFQLKSAEFPHQTQHSQRSILTPGKLKKKKKNVPLLQVVFRCCFNRN